jgi:valyl-tRNA synthetase
MKKQCINCKFYKVENEAGGLCRWSDKNKKTARQDWPAVQTADVCDHWFDSGQNYFVRLGWLQAQKKKEQGISQL